jgi:PKD repeat protein
MPPPVRICAILVFFLLAGVAPSQAAEPPPFHPNRILVIPKPGRENAIANLHRNHRAQLHSRLGGLRDVHVLELPAGADIHAIVNDYRRSEHVEAADPDYIRRATMLPNDPYVTNGFQWHLHNTGQSSGRVDADIDAPEAWDIANSASNIIVAVLDTGVRYTHEDLAENIWTNPGEIPGNNIDDDSNGVIDDVHGFSVFSGAVDDPNGHGTHVAGILGGVGNNGIGISGVAWRVRIMICRFLSGGGTGFDSDAIRCMNYARTNGAHILNCSWGSEHHSSVLSATIGSLRSAGIIVVAAAGNEGPFVTSFPAAFGYDNVVSVGAMTRTDLRASFSGTGEIYAPGVDIWSTLSYTNDSYGPRSGTSMAAPCVSGALALLRSFFPDDPYTSIVERLFASAEWPQNVGGITANRLNLSNALGRVVGARFYANRHTGTVPLTVDFTDRSFGPITNRTWDFGDGTFLTNVLHPSHTFNSTGLFQVVLTVTASNGLTSTATQAISARLDFPYLVSQSPYDWVSEGAAVVLTNGTLSPPQLLQFPFEFYGRGYTNIYIAAHGVAGFNRTQLDFPAVRQIPSDWAPNGIICPFWMWMKATNGGTILAGEYGLAPHRKAVFSWIDVHEVNSPTSRFTFQIILHESGHISMQYREVENVSSFYARGKSASIGIEDDSGLLGVNYTYRGTPNLVNNGQALVYTPPDYVPTPPRLRPAAGAQAGSLSLRAYTAPDQRCVLETSADLFAWSPIRTNTVPASGIFQLTLTNTPPSHQFYRLAVP